ncbi:MAG: lipopolysaccharide biosynthesis protein [Candidatus Omnitrophica bacterium]|nr:hypothetical protein [bacterium]NUN94603.1 lipopolysaccharide biosynthesis protein [Candidatus Omnitrophota bacterium]
MAQSVARRLFAQGGIYTLSRLFNQFTRLILLPVYALIGAQGVGIINLLWSIGSFLGFIYAQGLHGAWFRLRFDRKDRASQKELECTIVWYLLASGAIGVVALALVGPALFPLITTEVGFYPLGFLTTLTAALLMFPNLYERKLQAEQRPIQYAIFTAARTGLGLLLILFFILVLKRGAAGKVEADAIAAGLVALAALALIRPSRIRSFSLSTLAASLRYGLPLLPHSLAGLTNEVIDRILISRVLGLGSTGVYSMGYNLASLTGIVATALNQAYSTLFIQSIRESIEKPEEMRRETFRLVARAGLQMTAFVACVGLAVSTVAREALEVLPGTDFDQSWRVVPPVAAAGVSMAGYYVFSQSIVYETSRIGLLARISITAAITNIAANLLLLNATGSFLGAAWATFLSNTTMALGGLWLGQTTLRLPHKWLSWITLVASLGIGLAALYLLDDGIPSPAVRFPLKVLAAGIAAILVLRSAGVSRKTLDTLPILRDFRGKRS